MGLPYPAIAVKWKGDRIAVSTGVTTKYRVYMYTPEGERLWKFDQTIAVRTVAFMADGGLLIGTDASRVIALDGDGAKKWEYVSTAPIFSVESIGDRAYFLDNSGNYGALDANGKPVWKARISGKFVSLTGSETTKRLLITTDSGNIKLISSSGRQVYHAAPDFPAKRRRSDERA